MTVCALFTTLTAVGAFIKIPVPVVPFTLQFLFTTMARVAVGQTSQGLVLPAGSMALGLCRACPFLQRGRPSVQS